MFNHCSALRLFDHLWSILLKIASFDAPIIFMRELTKFYTYMALFKEYKNINFVIKRNMVESNKVTWMEPELCRDKLFFNLARESEKSSVFYFF